MFFGSSGSGFFLSVVAAAEGGLCSADGLAASFEPGDLIGNGFANAVPDASKPVSRSEVSLNIGKETSKQFRCPIPKQVGTFLRNVRLISMTLDMERDLRARWYDGSGWLTPEASWKLAGGANHRFLVTLKGEPRQGRRKSCEAAPSPQQGLLKFGVR